LDNGRIVRKWPCQRLAFSRGPLEEMVCAENNGDILNEGADPIPQADKPDF